MLVVGIPHTYLLTPFSIRRFFIGYEYKLLGGDMVNVNLRALTKENVKIFFFQFRGRTMLNEYANY